MKVSDVLSNKPGGRAVVCIGANATVKAAADLMAEKKIGAVLVTGGPAPGGIAGIISERDIVRGIAAQGSAVLDRTLDLLMTAQVVTCAPQEPIADVMGKMTAGRFRHVPVVEDHDLVGVISIGDVVKHRVAEIEADVEMMTAYVQS